MWGVYLGGDEEIWTPNIRVSPLQNIVIPPVWSANVFSELWSPTLCREAWMYSHFVGRLETPQCHTELDHVPSQSNKSLLQRYIDCHSISYRVRLMLPTQWRTSDALLVMMAFVAFGWPVFWRRCRGWWSWGVWERRRMNTFERRCVCKCCMSLPS